MAHDDRGAHGHAREALEGGKEDLLLDVDVAAETAAELGEPLESFGELPGLAEGLDALEDGIEAGGGRCRGIR